MSRVEYVANIRLPTEKAHGIQIMKMCEAFAEAGVQVDLVVPYRCNALPEDPFAFYGVKRMFTVVQLFSIDLVRYGRIGFLLQSLTFLFAVLRRARAVKTRAESTVYYSRDEMFVYALALFGMRVVWEAHRGADNLFIRSLIRRNVAIVCISQGLCNKYRSLGARTILVAPDGVDLTQFRITASRVEARAKLGLPKDATLIVYTGHLYAWKGANTLAQAASKLDAMITVMIVGGTVTDVRGFQETYGGIKNLVICGNKPHDEIPWYLRAADIVVIPNSAKEDMSRLYTSPMKLFEYMASGTPIIASDLPSIREVLSNSTAAFFTPDDSDSLAAVIESVLLDPGGRARRSAQAQSDILRYSWSHRARSILAAIFHD